MNNADAEKYEGIKYCLTNPGRHPDSAFIRQNQWEEYCSRMQIPCTGMKLQGRGMKVHFDYVTYDEALDGIFVGPAEEALRKSILQLFKDYSQRTSVKMECTALGMVTTITGVPPELAPAMAVELYDINRVVCDERADGALLPALSTKSPGHMGQSNTGA